MKTLTINNQQFELPDPNQLPKVIGCSNIVKYDDKGGLYMTRALCKFQVKEGGSLEEYSKDQTYW